MTYLYLKLNRFVPYVKSIVIFKKIPSMKEKSIVCSNKMPNRDLHMCRSYMAIR